MMHNQQEFKEAIEEVSKEWNSMLHAAIKDETDMKIAGNINYRNPIVSELQTGGSLEPLSNALSKLFELNW